jgi:hypothetical protein
LYRPFTSLVVCSAPAKLETTTIHLVLRRGQTETQDSFVSYGYSRTLHIPDILNLGSVGLSSRGLQSGREPKQVPFTILVEVGSVSCSQLKKLGCIIESEIAQEKRKNTPNLDRQTPDLLPLREVELHPRLGIRSAEIFPLARLRILLVLFGPLNSKRNRTALYSWPTEPTGT